MELDARLAHNAAIRRVIDGIAGARFVTIAELNGMALGGGLELALGCDLRFAAAGITLGLTESRVGAFPGAPGAFLIDFASTSSWIDLKGFVAPAPVPITQSSVRSIDTRYFRQQDLRVLLFLQNIAQRRGNLRWRKRTGCHLVQQWLEQMEIAAVD